MTKRLLYVYIPFVIYTFISFFNTYPLDIDLMSLFTFQGDLLLAMVFNMLGVFPILFLSYVLSFEKQPLYVYILFGMGFFFGGFVLLPALMTLKPKRKVISKTLTVSYIVLPILLLLMLIAGILFGDITFYMDAFLHNQFVHIMTIDLLVLILTPYVLGYVHWPFFNYTTWFTS